MKTLTILGIRTLTLAVLLAGLAGASAAQIDASAAMQRANATDAVLMAKLSVGEVGVDIFQMEDIRLSALMIDIEEQARGEVVLTDTSLRPLMASMTAAVDRAHHDWKRKTVDDSHYRWGSNGALVPLSRSAGTGAIATGAPRDLSESIWLALPSITQVVWTIEL
jgi:hypothetical protein